MNGKCLLLVVLVAGGLAGCDQHPAGSTQPRPAVAAGEVGSHLPDFALKDLQGNNVSSVGLRGKVILIDIWATWCQPRRRCRAIRNSSISMARVDLLWSDLSRTS